MIPQNSKSNINLQIIFSQFNYKENPNILNGTQSAWEMSGIFVADVTIYKPNS